MSRHGLPWILLALLIPWAGCGDDRLGPNVGSIGGYIRALDTRAPWPGARVVLLSPADNAPMAAVTSRQDGRYRFDGIPLGYYFVVVYAGDRIAYAPSDAAIPVRAHSVAQHDVLIAPYPLLPEGRVVTGVVRDSGTGRPVEGAYVSVGTSDLPSFFQGSGLPWEAITDPDGRFRLGLVPVVTQGSARIGLLPVVAFKQGYLPAATGSASRREWLPMPAPEETTRVELNLSPGAGTYTISGRVRNEGRGIARVPVSLSYRDSSTAGPAEPGLRAAAFAGAGRRAPAWPEPRSVTPGLVTYTRVNGDFEIRHVPPGSYQVHAAYLPDDGWFQVPSDAGYPEVVVGGANVDDVGIDVVPAIRYFAPEPGAVLGDGRPVFRWSRVPGSVVYVLILSRANSFILSETTQTADTTVAAGSGLWGEGDYGRWTVVALHEGVIVAAGETIATFSVAEHR